MNERTVVVVNSSGPVEPHGVRTSQPLSRTGTRGRHTETRLRRYSSDPGGRLPVTFTTEANYPTATTAQFLGEDGVVKYTEGRLVGCRYVEATEHDAVYPFGHGYSYAEFAYRDAEQIDDSTVRVTVENTSSRVRAVRSCRRTCVQLEESARLMARCGNSLGSCPVRIPAGVWVAIDIDLHEQAFARHGDDGWQETGGRLSSMWDAPRSTVESAWISDETTGGCLSATTQSRNRRWWSSSDYLPKKRVRGSQGPDLNRRWAALQAAALGRTLPPWHGRHYWSCDDKDSGPR